MSSADPERSGGGDAARIPRRILVVDDDLSIHRDYDKSLVRSRPSMSELRRLEAEMFGTSPPPPDPEPPRFELVHAFQGRDAVDLVQRELADGRRYAVAFVDVRMPPGWDGIETTRQLWEVDPDIQVVICTAHSDLAWEQTLAHLGREDVVLLKKPFEPTELRDLAAGLSDAWIARHRAPL